MATDNEPAKLLLPYLQRADELQKHEPLVAYYCRLYAMERGLKIPQSDRTKITNALLVSLMKQLEKDKMSVTLGPDDHLHVEGFASNVFARADKQDRAGRADLNTAKTFYAASIFFEILNQFGEVQPDLDQKQKYAAWKAADIRKALKEGRRPLPGPPGGDKDLSGPSSSSSGEYELEPSSTNIAYPSSRTAPDSDSSFQAQDQDNFQPSPKLARQSSYSPPSTNNSSEHSIYQQSSQHDVLSSNSYPNFQSYPSFTESSLPTTPSHNVIHPLTPKYNSNGGNESVYEVSPHEYDSSYQPPPEKIAEAHKAARFAVGALAFDDVSVAVDYLKKSLELLTNQSSG